MITVKEQGDDALLGRALTRHADDHADWDAAANQWQPIPVPTDSGALAAAGLAAPGIDQSVRMSVIKVDATAAVSRRLASGMTGYVIALVGDVHVATDADAADLKAGGRATIVDESGFLLRARSKSAKILLIQMSAVD